MRATTPLKAAVAALLACAAPLAAQTSDMDGATALRDAGRLDEAIAAFEAIVAARPADARALRLLGATYAAARRYGDASTTLARARTLAPNDRDIILAQARVALWSGDRTGARRFAGEATAIEPGHPELPQLRAMIDGTGESPAAFGMTFTQGYARVSLQGPNRDWWDSLVAFDVALNGRTHLTTEVERSDREIATDVRIALRLDRRLPGGSFYIGGAATPNAAFRERWSLRGGGEIRLGGSVVATIDARFADYGASEIVAIEPGFRIESRGGRYALAVRSINLWDESGEHRNGWAARGDVRPNESLTLFAGAATYPDTEAGITRRVDAFFAGSRFAIGQRLDLGMVAEHERRRLSYRRTGASLSLRWRFGG